MYPSLVTPALALQFTEILLDREIKVTHLISTPREFKLKS